MISRRILNDLEITITRSMKNREKISSNNEQFSKNHSRVDGYATYYFSRHEPCSLEFVSKKKRKNRYNPFQVETDGQRISIFPRRIREGIKYIYPRKEYSRYPPAPSPNLGKLTCTRRIVTAICILPSHARSVFLRERSQPTHLVTLPLSSRATSKQTVRERSR